MVNVIYQLSKDAPYNPYYTLKAAMSAGFTHNRTLSQQVSINVLLNTFASLNEKDQSKIGFNALGGVTGTLVSGGVGKLKFGNKALDSVANPIASGFLSEYAGDSDVLKDNWDNTKKNIENSVKHRGK